MLKLFKTASPGPNWIANESAILQEIWIPDILLVEYLGVCALRPYEPYLLHGKTDLEIRHLPPWVPIEVLKENPLIKLTDTHIILTKENNNGFRF
jgi:hypothetical protein